MKKREQQIVSKEAICRIISSYLSEYREYPVGNRVDIFISGNGGFVLNIE